jgi:hypothetical protein
MLEVTLAVWIPALWFDFFAIPHDREITRDGTQNNADHQGDGEQTLNHNYHDADSSRNDSPQIEADIKRSRESDSRNFAETEQVDHDDVQTLAFEWSNGDDKQERKELDDQ